MVILLTGATGFLGRHVLQRLLGQGHKVWALGRRPVEVQHENLEEIVWDFTGVVPEQLVPWRELDVVIHLAASGVKSAHREWRDALQVNVGATMRLLGAIRRHADQRPVVIVTRTFYEHLVGETPVLWDNPYIATKSIASDFVRLWSEVDDWPVTMATIFHLYGPGDYSSGVLAYAARQFVDGQPAYFGSGLGCRDWLFVEDAVEAIDLLLARRTAGLSEYDIGSGQLTSVRTIIETLAGFTHAGKAEMIFDPRRDRPDTNLKLAARRFPPGWQPRVPLAEGLQRFLAAMRTTV